MGSSLRTFTSRCRSCGQIPGTIYALCGHYQSAHPNIANGKVTFIAKDYHDNDVNAGILDGIKFLRRFAMHILPRQFVNRSGELVFTTTPPD